MQWETKKICVIHFIVVVWNRTHSISEVCLYLHKTGHFLVTQHTFGTVPELRVTVRVPIYWMPAQTRAA